eukprot:Colp12_sorted_trinity150504_noHs@25552
MFILNTLPTFLFFSTFCILLFFWAEIYHTMNEKTRNSDDGTSIRKTRPYFFVVNVVIYSVVITIYILDAFLAGPTLHTDENAHANTFQVILLLFLSGLYIAASIAFIVYWAVLRSAMGKSKGRARAMRTKITYITAVVVVFFVFRGVLSALSACDLVPSFMVAYSVLLHS